MPVATTVDEVRLRRFARLVSGYLRGSAAQGVGPRAAHDRPGAGLEFLDVRAYVAGDDLRHVDWRQSSRRGTPIVRRYRDERASDWIVCVDGSASMGMNGKWAMAAELATAVAYALIYGGHRVALVIFAERAHAFCAPGRGQHQFATILRNLINYQPPAMGGASKPGVCSSVVPKSGNLFLLSDFLRQDAMLDDLRLLRSRASAAHAMQILSNNETRISSTGPARLYDIESGVEKRLSVTAAAETAATAALQAHGNRLRQICAALDIRLGTCDASDSWEHALTQHLVS